MHSYLLGTEPKSESPDAEWDEPFAKVGDVLEGSPAYLAGLRTGDLVTKFGSLQAGGLESLRSVGDLVRSAEGQVIEVRIKRQSSNAPSRSALVLSVRPGKWSGRGLLGCHFLPVD